MQIAYMVKYVCLTNRLNNEVTTTKYTMNINSTQGIQKKLAVKKDAIKQSKIKSYIATKTDIR